MRHGSGWISEISAAQQGKHLRRFLDAYGGVGHATFIREMLKRQQALITQGHSQGRAAMADWASACLQWTLTHASELNTAG